MTYQRALAHRLRWVVAILLGIIAFSASAAEQNHDAKDSPAHDSVGTRSAITYKPLLLEANQANLGRSIDGLDEGMAILQVLAPDHVGLTTHAQPTLYWYERSPMDVRFEIIQTGEGERDALLKVESDGKKPAAIQKVDLRNHNISLQPGVVYQWSVTPVIDEKSSTSAASLAVGEIERIEPGEGLTSRIEKARGIDLVNVYPIEGIWYDALESISSMIDKMPEDKGLIAIRASLLEQVGLHAAAGK